MKKTIIKTSADLQKQMEEIGKSALRSIIAIMNEKGVTEIDLMLDDEGRDMDDEDYNEDWVEDNRVWALCSSKHGDEEGYVSSIKLNKKGDDILITAEGEDDTYFEDGVYKTPQLYIDILGRIEE